VADQEEKSREQTDEDLEKVLSQPFQMDTLARAEEAAFLSSATRTVERPPENKTDEDVQLFLRPVEMVLRPHISTANLILERLFAPGLEDGTRSVIEQYSEDLKKDIDALRKAYRVYVETAADETLTREATRQVRKYFQEQTGQNEINFVKLKRFYEKIKTFNEKSREIWRNINKLIDTFSVIHETRRLVRGLETDYLEPVQKLIRSTESFLGALYRYIQVNREQRDSVTGGYRIDLSYDANVEYTLEALARPEGAQEEKKTETTVQEEEDESGPPSVSIARSIILETRERRIHRASLYAVPILGSRDWNRSRDYSMEIAVQDYRNGLEEFKDAFLVVLRPEDQPSSLTPSGAMVKKGSGASHLEAYIDLIEKILNEETRAMITADFPGLLHPDVFLYHSGPNVVFRILIATLRQRNIGDVFRIDEQSQIRREYPETLIRKILIEWWTERFRDINGEQVDSYLTYSRTLEMIRKEFRALYARGVEMRKKEQPGGGYLQQDEWIRKNRNRIFGLRKYEVFRRFLSGTMFEF
tara:strand:+ start:41285 stop:42874 length:1590 start_codon:yes stop_codon:yes gene_type:complete